MQQKGNTKQTSNPAKGAAKKNSRAAISRHRRKCTVCQHPERLQIEQEFLDWRSPRTIAEDYSLIERAVYRHAHALSLFTRRNSRLRFSLGNIIERVDRVIVTPNTIIDAIRLFAQINNHGQLIKPTKRVTIEHIVDGQPVSKDQLEAWLAEKIAAGANNAFPAAPNQHSDSPPHSESASESGFPVLDPESLIVSARQVIHAASA